MEKTLAAWGDYVPLDRESSRTLPSDGDAAWVPSELSDIALDPAQGRLERVAEMEQNIRKPRKSFESTCMLVCGQWEERTVSA